MKSAFTMLIRVIIPLVIFYLAFTNLGTTGGIIVAIMYLIVMNLSVILNYLASRAYRKGEYEKALKALATALKLSPKNNNIRGSYAWLLLKLGHTPEAEAQINQALSETTREDQKGPLTVTKALVCWKRGELDEAVSLLEKVLETFKNSNAYGTLGFLYLAKGDLDKALSFNLEAYEFNDTNPVILDNLGCTRLLRKEYEESLEIYKKLLKLKPRFPEVFYNYARVLLHFDELDEAAYMCRTALSLNFWNTSTITRDQVEIFLKELEEAIEKKKEAQLLEKEPVAIQQDKNADI